MTAKSDEILDVITASNVTTCDFERDLFDAQATGDVDKVVSVLERQRHRIEKAMWAVMDVRPKGLYDDIELNREKREEEARFRITRIESDGGGLIHFEEDE